MWKDKIKVTNNTKNRRGKKERTNKPHESIVNEIKVHKLHKYGK